MTTNLTKYVKDSMDHYLAINYAHLDEDGMRELQDEHSFINKINEASKTEVITSDYMFARALDLFDIDPSSPNVVWKNLIDEGNPDVHNKWNWNDQLIAQGDLLVTQDIIRAIRRMNMFVSLSDEDLKELLVVEYDDPVANAVMAMKAQTPATAAVHANMSADIEVIHNDSVEEEVKND